MAPKASLTAAGRSAAAGASAGAGAARAAGALALAASAGAAAGAGPDGAVGEPLPYALLAPREKLASILVKLRGEGEWTQEELHDFMYWFRQALGLGVGVLWGYLPWTGFVAFLAFVAANVVAASALQGHLQLDDDHPAVAGGELVGEGMPGSISLFLVAWTLSYTAFHGGAEAAAAAAAAAAA